MMRMMIKIQVLIMIMDMITITRAAWCSEGGIVLSIVRLCLTLSVCHHDNS